MPVNPLKKSTEETDATPQELSFMRPLEPREPAEEAEKPSRAERRAAKAQAQGLGQGRDGKAKNLRSSQSVGNQRNFANRRSG